MIRQPGANASPFVPIIMLTGHTEKQRVTAARDAGITEFLAKPISAKALYQRIVNVVANVRINDDPFLGSLLKHCRAGVLREATGRNREHHAGQ